MSKDKPARKPYPSNLTDAQWTILAPLIPAAQTPRGGRPREVDMREMVNTLLYLNRSGCQWDMLPHDLLPKSTVYDYFARWRDDGTWAKLLTVLRNRPPASGSEAHAQCGIIDSLSVKTTEIGVPRAALMAARRSKGASGIWSSIPWAC